MLGGAWGRNENNEWSLQALLSLPQLPLSSLLSRVYFSQLRACSQAKDDDDSGGTDDDDGDGDDYYDDQWWS